MKCILVIPAWAPEEIFSSKTAGSQINYWQPLGTLYVASSLLKVGHDVRFINGAFTQRDDILDEIKTFRPDFAGLYSTTFGWDKAKQAAADIKKIDPGIFVAVGGPYPIAVKDRCLEDDAVNIDAVITGEGEATTVEMLESLDAGKGLEGVRGVIYRENGRIIDNGPRALIEDLDTLPFPARELLGDAMSYVPPPATYRRKPVAVMITSRGCNRRCIFCL
jgi:radical SAM superfamily enzyme YgiQ (UPF0313 family)